jgi:mitogen-activated protein kinase 7
MWSLGCIFAELLGSKPLFKGRDCELIACVCIYLHSINCMLIVVDQLNQILYILGTPDDDTLNRIGSERVYINL